MRHIREKAIPAWFIALGSAFLFGASTPAAKALLEGTSPQLLAGLLYLGSGSGLLLLHLLRSWLSQSNQTTPSMPANLFSRNNLPSLAGAILCGGVIAPLMLMIGLSSTSGGTASLLLNLEAVFTAAIAWFAFKEHFDKRIFAGMLAIVAGSAVISAQAEVSHSNIVGIMLIACACFCWALDNNLTRNIADADAVQIASLKGLVAGSVNCSLAFVCGAAFPPFGKIVTASIVGFAGYGISLVLFIIALRKLGTSRAGAYFSTAPFAGALLSLVFLHELVTPQLIISGMLMSAGVWLHLTEHHEHEHSHDGIEHEHLHVHDEHHQHEHAVGATTNLPHSHWHVHPAVNHSHPHFPDSQHRHQH